jgi:hypothetical protein
MLALLHIWLTNSLNYTAEKESSIQWIFLTILAPVCLSAIDSHFWVGEVYILGSILPVFEISLYSFLAVLFHLICLK